MEQHNVQQLGNPPESQPSEPADLEARVPAVLSFVLCALVIGVSLLAAIYFASSLRHDAPVLQSRLAVVFACFSVTVVLSLLFASTVKRSELKGPLGLFSVVLVGPSAFFIASLWSYTYLFPEDKELLTNALTLEKYGELIGDLDRRNDWISYLEWKTKLNSQLRTYNRDEEANIQSLLYHTYYHGDNEDKLVHPSVQTVFVYGEDPQESGKATGKVLPSAVKLQRISGRKAPGVHAAGIYIKASSTDPDSDPKSAVFVRRTNNEVVVPVASSDGSNLVRVGDEFVDCFTVAWYRRADIPEGDTLLISSPRYYQAGPNNGADVSLAVVTLRKSKAFRLWEIRPSRTTDQAEVPLLFKQYQSSPQMSIGRIGEDTGFVSWLAALDEMADKNDGSTASSVVETARQILRTIDAQMTFADCISSEKLKDKTHSYDLENNRRTLLHVFDWDEKVVWGEPSATANTK